MNLSLAFGSEESLAEALLGIKNEMAVAFEKLLRNISYHVTQST
jgi:hypothetical protein